MATYNLREGIPSQFLTGDILNYPYRLNSVNYGGSLRLNLPKGTYKLEAWGSKSSGSAGTFSTGGYAAGTLTLAGTTAVYLYAGGVGAGNGGHGSASKGSGSESDVRLLANDVYHRVLVAGGGGMPGPAGAGGGGGGPSGVPGTSAYGAQYQGGGGSATAAGANGAGSYARITPAGFGPGGYFANDNGVVQSAGGGGWYGGGAGGYYAGVFSGGGGGSGFAFSSATSGSVPASYALGSAYYLTDTANKTGLDAGDPITEPDGTTSAGHADEGYVRITVIVGQLPGPTVTAITEPTQGTMQISFSAVSGASSYKVYDAGGNLITTLNNSPYTETGITPNTSYVRYLSAYSASLGESERTLVDYLSKPKLATPTGLRANYSSTATAIVWNAVTGAESYVVTRNGTQVAVVTETYYRDGNAGAGSGYTYTVTAQANGRWDSNPASITTHNMGQLPNVTNLTANQTVSSVTLTWTAAANATNYDVYRDGALLGNTTGTSYADNTAETGNVYRYTVVSKASGYYPSTGTSVTVQVSPRLDTPDLIEAGQTQTSVTLNWMEREYGAQITYTLRRDGILIYQGHAVTFTDTGLTSGQTYTYTLIASIPGSGYYDSLPAQLPVLIGRDYTPTEKQQDYLKSLRRDFTKLCRLRFLNPNGTTAYALDNNPRNKRSRAFISGGSVSANLQNGQRMTATVTLDNVDGAYETAVNKIWFGQEVAIDEGLVLSNGEEYYRQTGVFVIDNPSEKVDPKTRTVTYRLLDKWAELDGTLGGNLEGTYEVPVGTNIFEPIGALLTEDKGNGQAVDGVPPVYTEYYNDKTQDLPDGTTASMTDSPYTLTVSGDGGTKAQVILGLAGMVNAWVGYDNTGRLRIDPSQDDILDTQKPVLWRFSEEETQLLGMAYTVKKEEVYNDYIIIGEQLDDYAQPGGRATNYDPRSDTNVYLIGRKTKRESASGYATDQQCMDLAEWRLKRSSVLQRAVSISCIQMMHIDLNSLVEIVRTDKEGSPIERHLIQGYSRPLAYNGAMTISAVSVNDLPVATVTSAD